MMQAKARLLALALCAFPLAPASAQNESAGFELFLKELWPDAEKRGIRRATFDAAFANLTPDARVMALTRRQPEYGKPVGEYLAGMVSRDRIEQGRAKMAEYDASLADIERKYGVDRAVLVAIWGVETSYGRFTNRWDVIRSLATLAQARFREPYFRDELLAALSILQAGPIPRTQMTGSWAGAMGHPQFMPSSYLNYAVDASGDGKRDIWTSMPDVFGSIANYLRAGWNPNLPSSLEVLVPPGFDYRRSRATFADWATLGLRRADGRPLPAAGEAILFFPSGASGPGFLVTENFNVIKRYNNSDVYALAVAQLADRFRGGTPVHAAWPRDDRQLTREARIALQRKLAERGHKVRNFTGHFDFDLRDVIRLEQAQAGLVPDGHPTAALLDRLGIAAR